LALRPKYLLIPKLRENITLSGRRWISNGSSKEGSGKEAGSKEGSGKEARSKEDQVIFLFNTTPFSLSVCSDFSGFYLARVNCVFRFIPQRPGSETVS
jgi:hypothetical protein